MGWFEIVGGVGLIAVIAVAVWLSLAKVDEARMECYERGYTDMNFDAGRPICTKGNERVRLSYLRWLERKP